MPRKATTKAATDMTLTANEASINIAASSADKHNKNLSEINKRFSNGQPYELQLVSNEVRFYLNHSAEAMLEAGKRLILIKEHEKHGDFIGALKEIGIAPRTAQRMMQAAVKFTGHREALANLGRTKMLELMIEDDEDLDALSKGGTVAGLTLDDMDCMTTTMLRKKLRQARQKEKDAEEVQERLLEQKDKKINQLDKKLHDIRKRSKQWDFRVDDYRRETTAVTHKLLEAISQLDELRDAFLTEDFGTDVDAATEAMAVLYCDSVDHVKLKADELVAASDETLAGYRPVVS